MIAVHRTIRTGRAVDSLVPAGKTWRTGANEPTLLLLTVPATIGGVPLAPGRDVLLTVPEATQWRLLIHTTPETDPAKMFSTLTRVGAGTGVVEPAHAAVEQFTIRAAPDGTAPALLLEWGTDRVRVALAPAPDR